MAMPMDPMRRLELEIVAFTLIAAICLAVVWLYRP
jgi:hypothetical protein